MKRWRQLASAASLGMVFACLGLILAPFVYPVGDLALARWRWARHGSASYTVVVNQVCNCYYAGEYKLTVRDGQVVSAEPVLAAWMVGPVPPQRFNEYTVEAGFERAAHALRASWRPQRYALLRIRFDPDMGYITRFETAEPDAPNFLLVYAAHDLSVTP